MSVGSVSLYLAQVNPLVGDIDGNAEMILSVIERARDSGAELVLLPELVVTGYPPEDLLLRPSILRRVKRALDRIIESTEGITVVVGFPAAAPEPAQKSGSDQRKTYLHNSAAVIQNQELIAVYHKNHLPNYQVFDELRYFVPGDSPCLFEHRGTRIGVNICEDIWYPGPTRDAVDQGAEIILNINASPFDLEKHRRRQDQVSDLAREAGVPIVYLNQVGGQDELVFDGASLVVDGKGKKIVQAPMFEDWESRVDLVRGDSGDWTLSAECNSGELDASGLSLVQMVYRALVVGVRDYTDKNGFKGVVLGLSGGIDSALTLAIAVDALGADRVEAIMMPFRYTSDLSKEDAADQARRLGVRYQSISIEPIYEQFMQALESEFAGLPVDTTEQNLQARCRGVIQMAISNKKGYLVLTTGNKSEMAVGYATLYGDMAGGFDALKDVPKTMVYRLARYRNTLGAVIPETVIGRPPSAELAPDQQDSDNLPDYDTLDAILERYIDRDESAEAIIAAGFPNAEVRRVIRLVDLNEYKRRQAAVGVRITKRGFGRDRRYPITNGWPAGD